MVLSLPQLATCPEKTAFSREYEEEQDTRVFWYSGWYP
jgi:hypothetical protein